MTDIIIKKDAPSEEHLSLQGFYTTMNNFNRHSQPFVMVLVVTCVLLICSFLSTEFNILGYKTKKVDPIADILLKGKAKFVPLPQRILNDSIIAKDSSEVAIRSLDPANILDNKIDSTSSLAHFFGALNEVKKVKKKVRIAYFGDSMIEGDLITQDLRNEMQKTFGGAGVGFVPITSVVAGFRTSIIHQFGGWTTHSLLNDIPANHVLGISGYSFTPETIANADTNSSSGSWVKYAGVKAERLSKFYETKLLYGKSAGDNYVEINKVNYKLDGSKPVNELVVKNPKGVQSVHAKFKCSNPLDIFGFSMESDSGAFVDNFSFRGNSGFPLVKVPQNIYSGTNECLGYDLVILEYGLNAVSPEVTDYAWYEKGMLNVIKHIKASFPNTSILIISVGDKGFRKDGVYQTDPSIPLMVNIQRNLAEQTDCAYWSLFDAMGGSGSMVKWVEGDTVFANKDYTHFNFKGAHKVGKLLYTKLMSEYRDFNKNN
ncbi:MAG: hypothetical protein K0S44_3364 [Bacteroidetes bacterium]|nr:hypothetical protein [Bacteroidota bacterium]